MSFNYNQFMNSSPYFGGLKDFPTCRHSLQAVACNPKKRDTIDNVVILPMGTNLS